MQTRLQAQPDTGAFHEFEVFLTDANKSGAVEKRRYALRS